MVAEWVKLTEMQDSGALRHEEADAISPEWSRLHGEICHFPARSLADLTAKAPLYRYERDDERASCKGEPTMPLRAWESVVQDIEGLNTSCRSTLAADPILAAIAETERLTAARKAAADLPMPKGRLDPLPEQDEAQDAFWAHVDNVLLKTVPTTAAGCAALARYAINFLKRDSFVLDEHEGNEHVRILELIARSPLLDSPVPRPVPAGDVDGTGFITYEDAGGHLRRRPIAQWIAFTAARLSSIAQSELTRQFNARYQGLSEEERAALEDELRRELRIDALHDLAFRSDQVFEVHKGHAVGHRWRVVGDSREAIQGRI